MARKGHREASGVLVIFFIWMLVTWMCSVCENSLCCIYLHNSASVLFFTYHKLLSAITLISDHCLSFDIIPKHKEGLPQWLRGKESESVSQSVVLTLFVTSWTVVASSSVHGILQARILEWVAISFSRGSSRPWD